VSVHLHWQSPIRAACSSLVMAKHSLTSESVGSQGCDSPLLLQLTWLQRSVAWEQTRRRLLSWGFSWMSGDCCLMPNVPFLPTTTIDVCNHPATEMKRSDTERVAPSFDEVFWWLVRSMETIRRSLAWMQQLFSSIPWWEPLKQHRQTLAVG